MNHKYDCPADCPKRIVLCHASCSTYKARQKRDALIRAARKREHEYQDYTHHALLRMHGTGRSI